MSCKWNSSSRPSHGCVSAFIPTAGDREGTRTCTPGRQRARMTFEGVKGRGNRRASTWLEQTILTKRGGTQHVDILSLSWGRIDNNNWALCTISFEHLRTMQHYSPPPPPPPQKKKKKKKKKTNQQQTNKTTKKTKHQHQHHQQTNKTKTITQKQHKNTKTTTNKQKTKQKRTTTTNMYESTVLIWVFCETP